MWHKYKYPFYLLCLALLCYWPLTLFQASLLCDDIDVALPTKYFAGECYQNGVLPLWNPFQVWGSPAHADLQYTNWNVETLLVGILKGYDYQTLHILFLGYLFLAGLGMFLLSKFLSKDERTGFFIGCVYMLSGLITGHVQSLVTILGMVWMPYVLLYFLKLLEAPNLRHAALLCVFSYLLMTLGYQAFVFMLLPLLVVLYISKLIGYYRAGSRVQIKSLLLWSGAALLIMALLLSPAIITQVQSKPFVSRLNGMPLAEVMSNPFSPYALVSLLNPMLTVGNDGLFSADITMRNFYIGLIPLGLLLLSFFKKKKTAFELILLMVAVVYLLGSFGSVLPMRELMYYVFPFFNLFRFPSLLRVIVFICLLCYLSLNFRQTIILFFTKKNTRMALLLALVIATATVSVYSFIKADAFVFFKPSHLPFHDRVINSSFYETAFYLSLLQLLILALVLIVSSRLRLIQRFRTLLLCASVTEAFLTIGIYGQHTAFSLPAPQAYQEDFAKLQKGFPSPSGDPVADNANKFDYLKDFWRNTGCYKKQLSMGDEWTSYYFTNYDFLTNHLPYLKEALVSYPIIYFSKPKPKEYPVALPVDTAAAFITGSFHARDAEAELAYASYGPNHIDLVCKTPNDVVLNLQQSYFKGWEISLDGAPVPPLWNAGLLMSVPVPQGEHRILFTFKNPAFTWLLLASYGTLALLLVLIIVSSQSPRPVKLAWAGIVLLCSMAVLFVFNSHQQGAIKTGSELVVEGKGIKQVDLGSKADFKYMMTLLAEGSTIRSYAWHNYYNAPELRYLLSMPQNDITAALNGTFVYATGKGSWRGLNRDGYVVIQHEDFEHGNGGFTDTTSYNHSRCLLLNRDNPYSTAFKTTLQGNNKKSIFGSLWVKCGRKGTPLVSCTIKHTDGKETVMYFHLNKYIIPDNSWQQVPFYFDASVSMPGDTLQLFVMNDTDATMCVDDLVYATTHGD